MKNTFIHIGLAKLCGWFGITRQAYYNHSWKAFEVVNQHHIIVDRVKEIRENHPRLGTRKLFDMLQPFFKEHQIKIGRDALFNVLYINHLLVRKRKRKKIGREWEALNKMQVEKIIEITKKHGFPGEKIIGIDTKNMHFKIRDNDLSAGMPIIIFIHHFSQPNKSYNSILKNEIQSGNLNNEHYAIISDFQYTYGKEKFGSSPCYSIKYNPKESKEKIDINRLEIGLLSLSNTAKLQSKNYITPFWIRLR